MSETNWSFSFILRTIRFFLTGLRSISKSASYCTSISSLQWNDWEASGCIKTKGNQFVIKIHSEHLMLQSENDPVPEVVYTWWISCGGRFWQPPPNTNNMPIIGQPQIFSNADGVQRCKLRNKPQDTHTRPGDFKDVRKQTLNYRDEALTAQVVARYIPTLRRGHGAAASLQKNIHRMICSCWLSLLLSDRHNAKKKKTSNCSTSIPNNIIRG